MAATDEVFEEWDADFLDQLIQVEELALSSANLTQLPTPQPPPAPPPLRTLTSSAVRDVLPPPPPPADVPYNSGASFASKNIDISYSPPRELSQRPSDSNGLFSAPLNPQELEIARLKKELERASNRVNGLEQECMELKRDREKKDKQLKSAISKSGAKKAEDCMRLEFSDREFDVPVSNHPGVSSKCQGVNTITKGAGQLKSKGFQAIGIQTDNGHSPSFDVKGESDTHSCLQKKLESIWSSSSGHRSRIFVTKLLLACTSDFCDLFGYLGLATSARTTDSLEGQLVSGSYINSLHSAESTRISTLCSVLTKIRDGVIQVDALFNILLDLCSTEDALAIHKSLCILHKALSILSTMESRHGRRENIKIEGLCAVQNALDFYDSENQTFVAIYGSSKGATSKLSGKTVDSTPSDSKGQWDYRNTLLSQVNFLHIVQKMCLIAVKSSYKQVQSEAVSIINAILVRTNCSSEREEYGEPMVFEAVAHLLRKDAGLSSQREAVRLLYLLLNCPKLLAKFCLGWKDLEKQSEATDGATSAAFQVSHTILQGLADCIGQYGNGAQDIKLRRNATVVLAFLASSGTSGFEIVLSHKLSDGVNILGLILRVLASDIDAETSETEPSLDIVEERTWFMREALILLNRLASNPATAATVLKVLTSNQYMVRLTVDVAARLSRECRQIGASGWSMKRIRQSEVTELARVFKKRVFSYLGESNS